MIVRRTTGSVDSPAYRMADASAECHITVMSARPDDLTGKSAGILNGVLDEAERSRLSNLKDNDARRQYLVAHALLRTTLSAMGPVKPSEWRFDRTPWGQPIICQPQSAVSLFFSLSHTRSLAVCAVSSACKVGVDVENIDANSEVADLTAHVLSEDEREWWQREGPTARLRRFYQLWTLKESLLKAVGRGLNLLPSCLSFRLPDGVPPELRQLPQELGRCDEWSFRVFEPTRLHVCALAAHVPPAGTLRVSWRHVGIEELADCAHGVRATTSRPNVVLRLSAGGG